MQQPKKSFPFRSAFIQQTCFTYTYRSSLKIEIRNKSSLKGKEGRNFHHKDPFQRSAYFLRLIELRQVLRARFALASVRVFFEFQRYRTFKMKIRRLIFKTKTLKKWKVVGVVGGETSDPISTRIRLNQLKPHVAQAATVIRCHRLPFSRWYK